MPTYPDALRAAMRRARDTGLPMLDDGGIVWPDRLPEDIEAAPVREWPRWLEGPREEARRDE